MRQREPGKEAEKSGDIKRARHRALHILERSDRTEQELRTKLLQNYKPEAVEDAVAYVKQYHYLDDMRYAVNYLNSRGRVKSRRQVEQELLYKKGIARETLEAAIQEAEPQDEREQIRLWMEKKQICPETASKEELRRFYLFLMRRGFRSEDILSEFRIAAG
ncbi:MAG TPA: RecX family transcriptional regulator [Candidatus Merdisoma merdipullorum]|nr:RecX family transcriptional regulator [Candidatus Merdisoma merdipullorum]